MISRRRFLGQASAAALYTASHGALSYATPLGLPLGIQLYSVRQELAKDYEGTLQAVASAGYTEVEAAGFFKRSAADVKQAMEKAKLRCVSSHHPMGDLRKNFDEILAFNKDLGVQYLICSSAAFKDPSASHAGKNLAIEDWSWNAEQFNQMGEKAAKAGIKFGYHNHIHEFTMTDGKVPYMELLRITDPAKVTFELDCGWAIVAGIKPEELMRDHPHRFSLFHVKDFKIVPGATGEPKVTELGLGSIDYRPIFKQAAKNQKIQHMFVEQEAFDMPYLESLKTDADYMKKLKV